MQNAIRSFLSHLRTARKMSANTVRAYGSDLADYLAFLNGEGIARPAEVTTGLCARFLDALEAQGRPASTRKRRLTAMRGLHAFALAVGLATGNPAEEVVPPRRRPPAPKVLSESQISALIRASDPSTPCGARNRAAVELAYSSGVRVAELLGIDLADLSLERREARIMGKGERVAVIAFGETAAEALRHYLGLRGRLAPKCDALFLNLYGNRLGTRGFRDILARLARRARIGAHATPHMLRHSCATHLHERGADVLTIKEVLRHRDISSTLIYTHFDRTRIREVLRRFHPRG